MPVILALLGLALIFPTVISTTIESQNAQNTASIAASRKLERLAIYNAVQRAVADIRLTGGAGQMQESFADLGLTVYTLTQLEYVIGQEAPVVRVFSAGRASGENVSNVPGNSKLVGTATFDPFTGLVSSVRFVEQQ